MVQIRGRSGIIALESSQYSGSETGADGTKPGCERPGRFLTGLLEAERGLRRGVDGQRAGPLHRAVGPAGDAVAPSWVGKPQTLRRSDPGCWSCPQRKLAFLAFSARGSRRVCADAPAALCTFVPFSEF